MPAMLEGGTIIKGTDSSVLAIRWPNRIEVWDMDAETCFGTLPAVPEDLVLPLVEVVMKFYDAGEGSGLEQGRALAQIEMRRALGLSESA